MKKLLAPLTVALGFLGMLFAGFLVSAHATGVAGTAAPEDGSLLDLARPIFDEVMKGHYVAAAALALILSVALVKRYAPGKFGTYVHSDAGGAMTTLLMAFGGALATATMGGAPWTWAMCWAALGVGVTAMGGYTVIKKLFVEPMLRPLMAKAPLWMQPLFGIVMWVFDKPTLAVNKAEAAGTLAVAGNPPAGTASVTGDAKDL
jgi:hypothetical protein